MSTKRDRAICGRTNSSARSLPTSARPGTSRSSLSSNSARSISSPFAQGTRAKASLLSARPREGSLEDSLASTETLELRHNQSGWEDDGGSIADDASSRRSIDVPNPQPVTKSLGEGPLAATARPSSQQETPSSSARSSARSQTAAASVRSLRVKGDGSLPSSFWDVPSEEWVEAFRNKRLKNPKRFVPEALRFAKPQVSMKAPLRSLYLDPSVNTAPQAKTQSELKQIVRERNLAHMSYDIDGDGIVDQDDMKWSKSVDVDGVGILKPEEAIVGKRILAERFFRTHKNHLHLFNQIYCKRPERENVRNLVTSNAFPEIYAKVKLRHQSLRDRGSPQIMSCMALSDPSPCQWNYYTDKPDATAWNDWGGLPRKVMYAKPEEHNGSRHKLVQSRRILMRDYASQRLEKRYFDDPMTVFSTKRIDLITNPKYLNSYV